MKKTILLLVFITLTGYVFGQTYDEKLSFVRKHFYTVENNLDNYNQKSYIYQPDENYPPYSYHDFWYDGNKLVKAKSYMGEEGYYYEQNFYFNGGKLIFYFSKDDEPDWVGNEMAYHESEIRVYFYDEDVFEYLSKYKAPDDERDISEIKNEKVEWAPEQVENILDAFKEVIEFSKLAE